MASYKVEICGVNTSKLPLLTEKEKEDLFVRIKNGDKQAGLIIDDLMATGGTMAAIIRLIEKLGGEVVKIVFLIELEGLEGRKLLADYDVASIIAYPGK